MENSTTNQERRNRNAVREDIGTDKILTEEERGNLINRLKDGVFSFRKNKMLRQALGEDNVLGEEQRTSILKTVNDAIRKFFQVGITRATEDETPKRQSFADRVRNEKKQRSVQK